MGKAYIAINYICNENCKYCPCSKREKNNRYIITLEEINASIDKLIDAGISDITLSGGEPTLHPDFLDVLIYARKNKIRVTILTNGEMFSSKNFADDFISVSDGMSIKVITTLHGADRKTHEDANGTDGSFERTIQGLKYLSSNGVRVIIKHCITIYNYRDLSRFYEFISNNFPESVDIQLCGIDYCGVPEEFLQKEKLSFSRIKEKLEGFFDAFEEKAGKNKDSRNVYCINIPLCSCDPYYWKYMMFNRKNEGYSAYRDPLSDGFAPADAISGTDEVACSGCIAKHLCAGTYHSAFRLYGKSIVNPIYG